ncbi:sulfotransferase domain-containing protein [Pleurocapsa sp. PCC 7319]|uniref:sulfotransferase domain-containing protein n=1 Tax=Pleurocapsa sp. PCC 7319 TaxID=118161 RepID=UPI00034A0D91|nr:sulfotransferase domain-containing protein [Pleurocapsa sp. PCC 7319]
MTLPNFIGIGAAKCGTTWLHELLKQHPSIYMPTRRKEINFFNFDDNYSKGLGWYESFFPSSEIATKYKAIGEFTPRYLSQPRKCAQRIASVKSIQKLILMVRNPVNRVYSQYGHAVRAGYNKSFEDFLIDRPWVIKHSFYAHNLEPFLEFYDQKQICFLVFEQSITHINETKKTIANFLKISSEGFSNTIGLQRVNQSYIPKYSQLNYLAGLVNRKLSKHDLDLIINLFDSLGIRKILKIGAQQSLPTMQEKTKLRLQEKFTRDIEKLEVLLDVNLDIWR